MKITNIQPNTNFGTNKIMVKLPKPDDTSSCARTVKAVLYGIQEKYKGRITAKPDGDCLVIRVNGAPEIEHIDDNMPGAKDDNLILRFAHQSEFGPGAPNNPKRVAGEIVQELYKDGIDYKTWPDTVDENISKLAG